MCLCDRETERVIERERNRVRGRGRVKGELKGEDRRRKGGIPKIITQENAVKLFIIL